MPTTCPIPDAGLPLAVVSPETLERWFGVGDAFANPVTAAIAASVAGLLVVTPLVVVALSRAGRIPDALRSEIVSRYRSWLVLAVLMVVPVLFGAFWVMVGSVLLGLLCFGEFARVTGLFRERLPCFTVVAGILLLFGATLDKWYESFMAVTPLMVCLIAAVAVLPDRPQGYLQRVALAIIGFVLFGTCLAHLGYMANTVLFRPVILWFILCVELNDVFAYIVGKALGKRKLAPNTSPGKTVAGSVGALVLTTLLAAGIGHFVFAGGHLDSIPKLLFLGALLSVSGQLGDLIISSVKRDLGIKDTGRAIPGHGGFLDRFDSMVLAAPVVFQVGSAFAAWEFAEATRIFSGG